MGSHVVLPGLEAVMNWRGGWGSAEGRRDFNPQVHQSVKPGMD